MNSENTSDDASNLDDFVNLIDIIPPKVKDQNIPAEYLISANFLVPGVITQYFDQQVLFKPYLSDENFLVPYNEIRHPSNEAIHRTYKVGDKVEVYMLDANLNLHGWAKSTVKSSVKDTYVVTLQQRNALVIVEVDKIRMITTDAYLNNRYLYTFSIPVPRELQNFASSIKVHDSFVKAVKNPHISYDFVKNALVINSNNAGCENIAKMLLEVYFENLIQRMMLTKSIDELIVKFQKLKTEDLLEQFQVHPDLLKYIIGNKGKNIRKAKTIPGVTFVAVLNDINTVKIYGQNKTALEEACEFLKLDKETIKISSKMMSKVIGKNGQKIQEVADKSNLRHIIIITNKSPASEVAELELIGTSISIATAKCMMKYYLDQLWKFNKWAIACGDFNEKNNTVFEDQNVKSSLESPAEDVPVFVTTRRVVTGQNYLETSNFSANTERENLGPKLMKIADNQDLVFYNEKISRGKAGIPLKGKLNTAKRSRGRLDTQITDYSEDKNANQIVVGQQFQPSTANSRGRSRGRGRGRGGRGRGGRGRGGRGRGGRGRGGQLALASIDDVNSISSRESQNDSSADENNEAVQMQPLVEAGDASTSRNEQELEKQRKQGAVKRNMPRNSQQRNKSNGISNTSNQTEEIQPASENQKSWLGKQWRKRAFLFSNIPTGKYQNLSKVFYGRSSTNNSTDATGDSATQEDDSKEEI